MAKKKFDIFEAVTAKIIEMLEGGEIPWRKPWDAAADGPTNLMSKKAYRGINVWLLGWQPYGSKWWVTYKQAKKLGGHVRKGEKSTMIVFWKWLEWTREDDEGETETYRYPMLRYYRVFNTEQCEGLEDKIPVEAAVEFDPIEAAEAIVESMPKKPNIKTGGDRAFYRAIADLVGMPRRETFVSPAEYYSTLFHELGHSTGHESRLKRFDSTENLGNIFGSESYSNEELVAEMTAAFLRAEAGITDEAAETNSAAYIQGWLKRLKDDKKLVVYAAAKAQKATDWIMGRKYGAEAVTEEVAAAA